VSAATVFPENCIRRLPPHIYLIRRSKIKYYTDKFQSRLNDASATWRTINSLMSRKIRNSKSINVFSGDRLLCEPHDVANCFNEYFVGVGDKLDRNIP